MGFDDTVLAWLRVRWDEQQAQDTKRLRQPVDPTRAGVFADTYRWDDDIGEAGDYGEEGWVASHSHVSVATLIQSGRDPQTLRVAASRERSIGAVEIDWSELSPLEFAREVFDIAHPRGADDGTDPQDMGSKVGVLLDAFGFTKSTTFDADAFDR